MLTGPRMMLGSTSDTSSRHTIMRHGFQSPSEMETVTRTSFAVCSSHQASRIPAHAKCSDNNDNGGSSESNTDFEDDSENDSSSTEDDTSESDRESACQMQHLVEFRKLLEVIEKNDRRLLAREKALTKREEALVEKFFEYESRHQEMLNTRQKKFEETLKGQQKEFEETMAKRKTELEAKKAKLEQEKISLKQRNMFQDGRKGLSIAYSGTETQQLFSGEQ
ncbi:MAG: hypothetical protein J3Q66DRAFT_443052 [Benniella sp.]|nr:MAG: hypothetical protein J3Q66DRAFT_443052 [Benniella sp.]